MSHANAALTPRARLRLAKLIVDDRWTPSTAAKMFMVSPRTARKWAERYRAEGRAGMLDRSSRPYSSPNKTPEQVKRRIVGLRWRRRLGPVQIAGELGIPASTAHAVLVRCRINRLSYIDRVTGEPIRRYEHPYPGSLIHVDVTKFGNIPDGGGHRFVGRQQGNKNRATTAHRTGARSATHEPRLGIGYVHTVIDDHSRVAYAEICANETADTAIGVLRRAVAWFADRGVTVERVLSDNGSAYKAKDWSTGLRRAGHHRQEDPPLPTPDERQDRTIPPHPGRRLGLRPLLRHRDRTPRSTTRLAAHLQSPPAPQRHRRQTTDQPTEQPAWTSHLERAARSPHRTRLR